jgi:hypothetical protein
MNKLTPKTRSITTIYYQSDKVPDGIDIELEFDPVEFFGTFVTETETGIKVGYVIQDECASNPLEDQDGHGVIHHHPRSNYGRRDSDYYSVLSLDSYGNPLIDEDKLQAMWHDKVMALPLDVFTLPEDEAWDGHQEILRKGLADEQVGDYTMRQQCMSAWRQHDISGEGVEALVTNLEEAAFWNYDNAERECQVPPNPDAIMLDLYDHSGCIWSISGTGMNCRFDTSRHESLWVPDKCLLEEVADKSPEDRAAHLHKTCEDALEMYNAWSSGEVYEVVIQVHDFDGTQLSCDYVDYCYGYEQAEKSLEEAMK